MRGAARGRSPAEWVTLSLSVLVVGALVVVALVEESRRQEGDRGAVEVTFDTQRAVPGDERYNIPYTVRNTGSDAISSA